MKIEQGVTRLVFVFKKSVLKVPNPLNGWIPFFQGFISNYCEWCIWWAADVGDFPQNRPLLCPVLKASPSGFWLWMRRVDRVLEEDPDYTQFDDITQDHKPQNFGILEGRLVCIDYG